MSLDSSVLAGLLGIVSVLLLWRERLAWWTKAGVFAAIDVAALFGVINGFLGTYFSADEKMVISIVGFLLIPVAFGLSWFHAHRSRTTLAPDAKPSATQAPPTIAQDWIIERINVQVERWVPNPTRAYSDGTFGVSGSLFTGSDARYEYNIRIAKDGNVVTDRSSVTGVT